MIGVSCTFIHQTFLISCCRRAVFCSCWHRVSWPKMLHKNQYIHFWLVEKLRGFIYHESHGKSQWLCEATPTTQECRRCPRSCATFWHVRKLTVPDTLHIASMHVAPLKHIDIFTGRHNAPVDLAVFFFFFCHVYRV